MIAVLLNLKYEFRCSTSDLNLKYEFRCSTSDVKQRDLEDIFYKYGRINFIDIKFTRDVPFAFIEFDDPRDARDAVHGRDGYDFDGCRIRVELTRGVGPRGPGGRPLYGPDPRSPRRGPPPRRSGYRVIVSGLPDTGSWQDLKVKLSYYMIKEN
ncbi:hypothetical protein WUBG_18310 [Wuchereria bancrofti]|uniref:RRM domain-containing protein n=1 Tax=Wuchereria bancrofti TaxID=6293 RepID=J9E1I3_WUCBA|nr:hypothetical protein WUBG_18310 [Wuchereria bancrofti]